MKPIYIRILTIFALIVFISILTTSCDGNQNIQKERQPNDFGEGQKRVSGFDGVYRGTFEERLGGD